MTKRLDSEAAKHLVDFYEAFLRVGRVTSEEFMKLDDDERACLLLAQKRIEVERAMLIAVALRGSYAQLMSEVDGGDTIVREVTDAAVARYMRRVA